MQAFRNACTDGNTIMIYQNTVIVTGLKGNIKANIEFSYNKLLENYTKY